uniref:Putative secreted protein n=1 Tax=Ixodes ricinus TaxID=34613 RepID=A0A147BDN1_IXORI
MRVRGLFYLLLASVLSARRDVARRRENENQTDLSRQPRRPCSIARFFSKNTAIRQRHRCRSDALGFCSVPPIRPALFCELEISVQYPFKGRRPDSRFCKAEDPPRHRGGGNRQWWIG